MMDEKPSLVHNIRNFLCNTQGQRKISDPGGNRTSGLDHRCSNDWTTRPDWSGWWEFWEKSATPKPSTNCKMLLRTTVILESTLILYLTLGKYGVTFWIRTGQERKPSIEGKYSFYSMSFWYWNSFCSLFDFHPQLLVTHLQRLCLNFPTLSMFGTVFSDFLSAILN